MKPKAQAVLIHPDSPEVLFSMLKDYLRTYGEMKMLFASSVSYGQYGFLELVVLGNKKSDTLNISLASSYVLAIADSPDGKGIPAKMGFQ
jgi:hypothetical protein